MNAKSGVMPNCEMTKLVGMCHSHRAYLGSETHVFHGQDTVHRCDMLQGRVVMRPMVKHA